MTHPPDEEAEDARASAVGRRGMVVLAVALGAVLAVARWLEPDPRGYGTHTQLGLPPCTFARVTGKPCPSCGMTTAFAWSVRGRFGRAWAANPAGSLLAPVVAALVPWLLAGAARGKPPGVRSPEPLLLGLVVASAAVALVSWAARLLVAG